MVALNDIRIAQSELPSVIRRTPMLPSEELSAATGSRVFLKCENLQVTGSYKVRAAFTILNRLSAEQKQRGAALSSSGNFASAFAYMGRLLGVPTTIVMMQKTVPFKVEKTQRYGGEILFCENRYEARFEALARLQRERGIVAINHLEDANVIIGHGTIGAEIMEQLPDADAVLVPVSTGGLIAGVATAVKQIKPAAQVIGVQPEGANATYLSFQRGEIVKISAVNTICDALTATYPGALPWEHIQRYVDDVVTVSDEEVKDAVVCLAEDAKCVVEAGGAVTVAALRTGKVSLPGKTVVALLSGGNIAPATLAGWLAA
ncbi:MAG: threonine/serine dehydratase, partial [Abditibacteriales bacterium]|nr:threonine/serine dehydratase [Abditibacteriales bacterium]MDW8368336.1 threonine/serine dehydratase [Abditibacteriales bacterium]